MGNIKRYLSLVIDKQASFLFGKGDETSKIKI